MLRLDTWAVVLGGCNFDRTFDYFYMNSRKLKSRGRENNIIRLNGHFLPSERSLFSLFG